MDTFFNDIKQFIDEEEFSEELLEEINTLKTDELIKLVYICTEFNSKNMINFVDIIFDILIEKTDFDIEKEFLKLNKLCQSQKNFDICLSISEHEKTYKKLKNNNWKSKIR